MGKPIGALTLAQQDHKRKADRERMRQLKAAVRPTPPPTDPKLDGRIHIVIGDTQVKPGVPTDHLTWIGRYIVDKYAGRDVTLIHLGDHWDLPSLSSYDKGKKAMEGRRYKEDVRAGNAGFKLLCDPIERYNALREEAHQWWPEAYYLFGNHCYRVVKACEADAQLDGVLSLDDLDTRWWDRVPFLEVKVLDGVAYSHYFYNVNTSKPHGGESLDTRLKNIGRSFTMGHQQGLKTAMREVGGTRHQGLVLGSTYLHDENYIGPQGNKYWRGIVIKHQVEAGTYDPMFVSLDYLCRRYEQKTLAAFMSHLSAAPKQEVVAP